MTALLLLCVHALWAANTATDKHTAKTVMVRQAVFIPADRALTLEDCLCLAQQNQSTIRQAQAQIQAQAGLVKQARAALLPASAFTVSHQLTGGSGSGTTQTVYSANQLIFDFGHASDLLSQAKEQRAASEQNLTVSNETVMFNVKQAYYTLLEDSHLVDVYSANLTSQQAQVAMTKAEESAGTVPHATVLTAETAAASAQVELVNAQNTAEQARYNLNTAMGVDLRSAFRVAEATEPDTPVPSEDDAVALAMQQRPEIRRDIDTILAEQKVVKANHASYYPALSAALNYSPNPQGVAFGAQKSFSANLNVSWPFPDLGAIGGAVQTARAQVVIDEEALYTDKQTIAAAVVQARQSIVAAQAQYASAQVEVTSAQQNVDAAVGSFRAGVGIYLAVVEAQAALLKAQVDEFTAQYGLSIARAALQNATGVTTP